MWRLWAFSECYSCFGIKKITGEHLDLESAKKHYKKKPVQH
jgi:hypothetical protein